MGVAQIMLDNLNLSNIVIGWYRLFGTTSMVSGPPSVGLSRRSSISSLDSLKLQFSIYIEINKNKNNPIHAYNTIYHSHHNFTPTPIHIHNIFSIAIKQSNQQLFLLYAHSSSHIYYTYLFSVSNLLFLYETSFFIESHKNTTTTTFKLIPRTKIQTKIKNK